MKLTEWYRLFTWLCLAANAAFLLLWGWRLVALVSSRAHDGWNVVRESLQAQGLAVAALVAAVAMAGSLYLSEGGHLTPCRLCWFQRTMMYPLAVILVIAAVRRDWSVRPYAITLALLGATVSAWHYLVEWYPSIESAGGSCEISNPCSALPLPRHFGYISIPFMAG